MKHLLTAKLSVLFGALGMLALLASLGLLATHPAVVSAAVAQASRAVADVVPSPAPTAGIGTPATATPPPDATAPDASVAPLPPTAPTQAPAPTVPGPGATPIPTPQPAPLIQLACSVSVASGSAQVAVGETAYFSASTSEGTAPFDYYVGGAPVGVRDWGGEGALWSHGLGVFRAGSYAVTVTVTDAQGRSGVCAAGTLIVAATAAPAPMPTAVPPPPPTAAPTPATSART